MAIQYGFNSFIRLDQESAWGSAVSSPGVSNRIISCTLQRTQERERKTHLSTPASGMLSGLFDGFENTGGNITMPIHYTGQGQLIKCALGAVTTSGAGPTYTHLYVPNFDPPSMTIQFERGTGLTDAMEEFTGCMVSQMTLSCEAGGELTGSFDIIAKTGATRSGSATAASYGSGDQIFHFEAGTLAYDSNTYTIRSFDLVLNNNLDRRNNLGSKLTGEPVFSDVREVTMAITADMEDNTLYNSMLAGDQSDVTLVFTSTANSAHTFKIKLTQALLQDYSDSITSFGRVERSFTFLGTASAANAGLEIEIINGAASATTN